MPSHQASGRKESTSLSETRGRSRGRTRYCKKCKFSCTDAREFSVHLASHSEVHAETPPKVQRAKRVSRSSASESQTIRGVNMEGHSRQSPISPCVNSDVIDEKDDDQSSDEIEDMKMEDEDDQGDEPDAMTNDLKITFRRRNHISKLNSAGSDEAEDEGKLIIADDLVTSGISEFQCQWCPKVSSDYSSYMLHIKENHSQYICEECDYITSSKQKMGKHKELHQAYKERLFHHNRTVDKHAHDYKQEDDNFLQPSPSAFETSSFNTEPDNGDEEMVDTPNGSGIPLTLTPDNIDQVMDDDKKKKKKTRQEVDPGKYFEVVDSVGTKFACSQCGNIYKWRKSLNKHWKEKHSTDPLVEVASPPGMLELLKSNKYTQLGARRIYDNIFLSTIKTQKDDPPVQSVPSPSSIPSSPSPPNFLTSQHLVNSPSRMSSLMPKIIGPFVASSSQSVFPVMTLGHPAPGYDTLQEPALNLSLSGRSSSHQDQPLDYSKKKESTTNSSPHDINWEDFKNLKPAHTINQLLPKIHQCSKCEFTSTCEIEFANHTSSHLSKKIVKCFQCNKQINSMEELNSHFMEQHHKKLTDYKEAIKKIPHGLQQTYHLLKMDLQDIGDLNNQDLGAPDAKSLKCKKCGFEAKWPAELQKHAVSHSEERPYVCMVCGSTYKWKWDLVKHFQKSHHNLLNPYRRNDKRDSPDGSADEELDEDRDVKRFKLTPELANGNLLNHDDNISVEGIMAATQAGQRFVSSQPNILDGEPDKNVGFFSHFRFTGGQINGSPLTQAVQDMKAQKMMQEASKNRQNASSSKKVAVPQEQMVPSPGYSKTEELPYKCTMCNYHARWPSEVTQHMKNHSDSKPYLCPRCEYRSKWKWDVVKHLKRCGGGGINDVIDTTKNRKRDAAQSNQGPPNAVVSQQGKVRKVTSQSTPSNLDEKNMADRPTAGSIHSSSDDHSRSSSSTSTLDLNNSNETGHMESTTNNNYTAYSNGQPFLGLHLLTSSALGAAHVTPSPSPCPSAAKVNSTRTSDTVWNCPHCSFTTASQAELKRHSGLHSDDKPFKCDVCQYSTRWACDLKKHRKSYDHYPSINRDDKQAEKPQGRFRCSQCALYFQSLQNLLEHRVAQHIGRETPQASPVPQESGEIDAARIKHPRKPIKQLQCNKCSFVCKNRQTMEKHKEEHEQLDSNGFQCFYCNSQFKVKESLLDHMSSHSEFKPKEWETFFMIGEDEDHLPVETKTNVCLDKEPIAGRNISEIKQEKSLDSTEARIQQILNEVNKQTVKQTSATQPTTNKFQCEWCPAEFLTLTAVYKHAAQAHPIQLKEQDVTHTVTSLKAPQPSSSKKTYSGEPLEILRQQIADKRNQQLTEKISEMISNNPRMQQVLSKKIEDSSKKYCCDKCQFSSADLVTFQKHYELHGSKSGSQCWFCDFSVDKMHLLYQHMKISHARKWKAVSQDPKYSEHVQKMNLAFASFPVIGNNNDSPPESSIGESDAIDLSSKRNSEVIHDIEYTHRQQYTWSGIPINILPVGNGLKFACPNCEFSDTSIGVICTHVMSIHRAMAKYTCKKCQFADDNIHVMSDHCKMYHAVSDRKVEVLSFKQLNFSELQMVQLAAMKEKQGMTTSAQEDCGRIMSCPFCPYKSGQTEQMKNHLSNHSRTARYKCDLCDFSSDLTSVISDHVKVHDKTYGTDTNNLLTVKEEMLDSSATEFRNELNEPKSDIARFNREKIHSPKSKSNGRIRYRCLACPYQTSCKSNIIKHRRQHLHNKKYKCSKCSYSSARAVLLTKHTASHNSALEDDGLYHDIFYDPLSNEDLKPDDEHDEEMEEDEFEEDETNSEDLDEMDAKAIADLEAKDILEAEAALKATSHIEEDQNCEIAEKQFRKQKCSHCPFSSNSGQEYRKHLNFHGKQERFKCDRCSYSIDRLNLLTQHRKLHTDEPGFNPNSEIADLLNTQFIFQQNQLEEHGEKGEGYTAGANVVQYSCNQCSYKTCNKQSYDMHCSGHGLRQRYICDYCDWSSDRLALLCQHRMVHENESNFDAGPEDKVFLNQEFDDGADGEFEAKLMEVKNMDKQKKEGETEASCLSPPFKLTVMKKIYQCKLCPYRTNSGQSFSVHNNMHDSEAQFKCTKCSYAAINKGLLQQHMNLHVSMADDMMVKDFTSQEVDSKDSQDSLLVNGNQGNKSPDNVSSEVTCPQCPFIAMSCAALKEHIKCHTPLDGITYSKCDLSTVSQQALLPHLQGHLLGNKLCSEAVEHLMENQEEKSLDDPSILNNNNNNSDPIVTKNEADEKVKTKRVYVCQYCEREFEAKDLMIQHEKQHLVGSH